MPGDRLVWNVPEAADQLGVSTTHLRKMVAAGQLPHQWIGRRLLFPKKALDKWANEQADAGLRQPDA